MKNKKVISLCLTKELIEKIDHISSDSRSRMIEELLKKQLEQTRHCVILAGGHAKNLWVPELGTYRPFVKIGEKTLIEDIVQKVRKIGYNKIVVVGSKKITSKAFELLGNGGSDFEVKYVIEKEPKNTANTLLLAKDIVKDTFLFVPCDHYFDFDLKKLLEVHKKSKFVLTLALYTGTSYVWNKSSIVELNGNEIVNYWERPEKPKTFITATLSGFCEPEIFSLIPEESSSLQEDVFPLLVKMRRLGGAILSGNFVNVHTKKDLEMVSR